MHSETALSPGQLAEVLQHHLRTREVRSRIRVGDWKNTPQGWLKETGESRLNVQPMAEIQLPGTLETAAGLIVTLVKDACETRLAIVNSHNRTQFIPQGAIDEDIAQKTYNELLVGDLEVLLSLLLTKFEYPVPQLQD
jgi:hypothetical protein